MCNIIFWDAIFSFLGVHFYENILFVNEPLCNLEIIFYRVYVCVSQATLEVV